MTDPVDLDVQVLNSEIVVPAWKAAHVKGCQLELAEVLIRGSGSVFRTP
jgi:hypothetical protein